MTLFSHMRIAYIIKYLFPKKIFEVNFLHIYPLFRNFCIFTQCLKVLKLKQDKVLDPPIKDT